MPAADHGNGPRVRSWITPKAAKGGASVIAGQGDLRERYRRWFAWWLQQESRQTPDCPG